MDFSEKKRDGFLAPSLNKKEQIATSALLLFLSLHQPSPPSLSSSSSSASFSSSSSSSLITTIRNREVEEEISISYCSQETPSCITDSCSSSTLTAEVDQIHGQPPLRLLELAAAATSHASFLSPKVVKKARSKIHRKKKILSRMRVVYDLLNSEGNKDQDDVGHVVLALSTAPSDAAPTATASAPGPSSSSVASAVTSTKRNSSMKAGSTKKNQDKTSSSSSKITTTPSSSSRANGSHKASRSINRRALAIVNWLAGAGCASEVNIRAAVGDSPDTSKALRLLVKRAEVNRTGAGGRTDPFLYAVTSKGTMQ